MEVILKLNVFWNTPETRHLLDAGLEPSLKECSVKEVTFYRIDAVGIYYEKSENKEYATIILAGEQPFITPFSYEELNKKVLDARSNFILKLSA